MRLGYITLSRYSMPLNCTLKQMVKMRNMLCMFYRNTQNKTQNHETGRDDQRNVWEKKKKSLRTEPWGAPSVWNHCGSKNCTDCDPQYEKHFPSWLLTWTRGHTHETEIHKRIPTFPTCYIFWYSLFYFIPCFLQKKKKKVYVKQEKRKRG